MAPTITTTTVAAGEVTVETWGAHLRVELDPGDITLPPGRWLVHTVIAEADTPAAVAEVDDTLAEAGTVAAAVATADIYRADADRTARCQTVVYRRDGDDWLPYRRTTPHEITVPALGPAGSTGFGGNVHLYIPADRTTASLDPYLDLIEDAGATWVRTSTPWLYLNPSSATFDAAEQDKVDAFYAACASRNLSVCAILQAFGAPAWADGAVQYFLDPGDYGLYGDFVEAYLTRWAPAAIEVANEPNHQSSGLDDQHAYVVEMTHQAWTAKQSTRPATKLLAGCMAFVDPVYLEALYTAGLADFDAVAIHPYPIRFHGAGINDGIWRDPRYPWPTHLTAAEETHLPTAVAQTWRIMDGHGHGDRDIWVTEVGASPSYDPTAGQALTEAQAESFISTTVEQAAHIDELAVCITYKMMYEAGWDPRTWGGQFSMVEPDGTVNGRHEAFAAALAAA